MTAGPDRARGRGVLGRGRRLRGRSRGSSTSGPPDRGGRGGRATPDVAGGGGRAWFDVTPAGNFEGPPSCAAPSAPRSPAAEPSRSAGAACSPTGRSRVRPGLDDKVLTEWNAMYASALAEAAGAAGRTDWADGRRRHRRVPVGQPARRRRPMAAELAARRRGPAPRLCRRPRLAGRLLHPHGRADRSGGLDRAGRRHRRRPHRPVRRPGGRRVLHDGVRRRAAHRPHQGRLRRCHPVGQRRGRPGPRPPRRPDRRRRATPRTPGGWWT